MTAADLSLIETMHFDPVSGIRNRARHLARMQASAATLGFTFAAVDFDAQVDALPRDIGPLRVRLELRADGSIVQTHAAFTSLREGTLWRLAIASTRLSSADPLLRHKTSARDHYNSARAEFPVSEVDEVLLLNERDAVCEGSFTSLFLEGSDGLFRTPPLEAGLLAGVLRARLLDEGKAITASLTVKDLSAGPLYIGNSLRGLIPARLVR